MEYKHYLFSSRPDYGSRPVFTVDDGTARKGFNSLYAVDAVTAKAIEQAGTTQGFKGVVWAPRLWLDFDSYEAAERAEGKLKELGYDYISYDTGGRGAHFGILRKSSSGGPSHLLPREDRQWVQQEFPEADKSIYTHLHPFRLPGTVHSGTGRVKELVSESRGTILTLPPLERETYKSSATQGMRGGERSLFDCFRLMAATRPAYNGSRHDQMVKIIYALKDDAGATPEIALWWVEEWNKMLSEPKGYGEIEKAVLGIYRG